MKHFGVAASTMISSSISNLQEAEVAREMTNTRWSLKSQAHDVISLDSGSKFLLHGTLDELIPSEVLW